VLKSSDSILASGVSRAGRAFRQPVLLVDQARWLDLEADVELALGHSLAAERLSRRAAELRVDV